MDLCKQYFWGARVSQPHGEMIMRCLTSVSVAYHSTTPYVYTCCCQFIILVINRTVCYLDIRQCVVCVCVSQEVPEWNEQLIELEDRARQVSSWSLECATLFEGHVNMYQVCINCT